MQARYQTMVDSAGGDDWEAVKDCFTAETRADNERLEELSKEVGGTTWGENLKLNLDPTYGEEKIDGDKGTLEMSLNGESQTVHFIKEDGAWKVSFPFLKQTIKTYERLRDAE